MTPARPGRRPEIIGYARVSTVDQDTQLQIDALAAAGCTRIVEEKASGATMRRPVLVRMLADLKAGDTVVVWKLDRVGRSLVHLLGIIERIREAGAHFRCLTSPVDTSSSSGKFQLQILGAAAEYERALTRERTVAGLAAARQRGRVGGNRLLKARDPAALAKASKIRKAVFIDQVTSRLSDWKEIADRMRPAKTWEEVLSAVNAALPPARHFTLARLLRHARTAVDEKLADARLLDKTKPADGAARIERHPAYSAIVVALRRPKPPTLKDIAGDLKAANIRTSRGQADWPLSSLGDLVARVKAHLAARAS